MKNIDGIIKSILYSDRPVTPKNIKFPVLREILLSNKMMELLNAKNSEMRKLILYYQKEISADRLLKEPQYYLNIIESIQNERLNKVLNGDTNKILYNRLKKVYENEEIEEIKKDRGVRRFSLRNGSIDIKITTLPELEYDIKMLQLDTIYNIITTYTTIKSTELISWYEKLIKYAKETYGNLPVIKTSSIYVGENDIKTEEYLLYHCLTNDKIYCVNRNKLKF
jgi:hypothetical protein